MPRRPPFCAQWEESSSGSKDSPPLLRDSVAAVQQHYNPEHDVVLRSEYIPEKEFKARFHSHLYGLRNVGRLTINRRNQCAPAVEVMDSFVPNECSPHDRVATASTCWLHC